MSNDTHSGPIIKPILPGDWSPEAIDALGAFPSSRDFVLKQWNENTGDTRGYNTLGFLAHYPALAKAYLTLNKHVAADTRLSFRQKEIVLLRAAQPIGAINEFAQHIVLGRRAGLNDEELRLLIHQGPVSDWPSEDERPLLTAADELSQQRQLSRETMAELMGMLDHEQIMDLIMLHGCYNAMAAAINSFDIPLDDNMRAADPLIGEFFEVAGIQGT